jgi:hypothetical protein
MGGGGEIELLSRPAAVRNRKAALFRATKEEGQVFKSNKVCSNSFLF